jgi:predicted RNA polymerase sigma factor
VSEEELRGLAPRVLSALVRRHGDFDGCEDAVQEALLAAAEQWPAQGRPENPLGWLITVGSRRWTDAHRHATALRLREERAAALDSRRPDAIPGEDDTLALLLLCCHPALTAPSQVALTLRAVGGLSTAQIARALLVPEPTLGQRISRAKARIRAAGATFAPPPPAELPRRLASVLRVLYLIFNEGSTASSGAALHRVELSAEAIRLARRLQRSRPGDGEAAGLLALMLLTDARRPARTDGEGALVPLERQDRSRWDRRQIEEGRALVERALSTGPVGAYGLQAAIAALHDEAPSAAATDWPQILALYDLLAVVEPGPMVRLNRVVAVAMVEGPERALDALAEAERDAALAGHHRTHAVRAHLLERAGDRPGARAAFRTAAALTHSVPEQRYLRSRAG